MDGMAAQNVCPKKVCPIHFPWVNYVETKWSTHVFDKQHSYGQRQVEFVKNQANAKQHPEAELLLYENYSHSSSTISSKINRRYSKK